MVDKIKKSNEQWRKQLDDAAFHVMRQKGTEKAFSGEYHDHKGEGIYRCKGCGQVLFSSETKFDSGSGWPSFHTPVEEANIREERDNSHGMLRIEILCDRCDSHLGHVFNDGPRPSGLRYCVNSASLDFDDEPGD